MWTMKARLLFLLAAASHLLVFVLAVVSTVKGGLSVLSILYYVLSICLVFLYFILYTIYVILLWPVDFTVKKVLVMRANLKILNLKSETKVIGIAGSYGKTTMKEVLAAVLSAKFKTIATPESVNTPVGIARWILNKLNQDIQIIIVEMGEHYKGDVKDICKIAKPDIAVVTGINEAHLERMKKLDTIVETIFEIVSNAKAGAMVVINGDDRHVMEHYKEFVWPDNKIEVFKIEDLRLKEFNTEMLQWEAEFEGIGKVKISLLGEYALGDVSAAVKIARSLGMANEEIIAGIKNIKPVEHRLQGLRSAGGIVVIDDAYNGNPEGAAEAIKVLSRFKNRRKVFITPGLVEMGKSSAEVHRQIGRQLAGVADVVVLIKNSVTPWIEEGIKSSSQQSADSCQLIWFSTAPEAHQNLSKILKPGDTVLFQNDWGDQYV